MYRNAPDALRKFMPDAVKFVANEDSSVRDPFGNPMPPFLVMEKGECLSEHSTKGGAVDPIHAAQVCLGNSPPLSTRHMMHNEKCRPVQCVGYLEARAMGFHASIDLAHADIHSRWLTLGGGPCGAQRRRCSGMCTCFTGHVGLSLTGFHLVNLHINICDRTAAV